MLATRRFSRFWVLCRASRLRQPRRCRVGVWFLLAWVGTPQPFGLRASSGYAFQVCQLCIIRSRAKAIGPSDVWRNDRSA
jgi:hypothetical protein